MTTAHVLLIVGGAVLLSAISFAHGFIRGVARTVVELERRVERLEEE